MPRARALVTTQKRPIGHSAVALTAVASWESTLAQPLAARPEPSADLLRQLDDDPLRAADVAEPIDVLVVLHLANELPAARSHAGDGVVDIVDCECDMADARSVRRRAPVAATARRGVKPSTARAVRGHQGSP